MTERADTPGGRIVGEVPPNQGVKLSTAPMNSIKEGDIIYVLTKPNPNEVSAIDTPFKVTFVSGKMTLEPVQDELGDEKIRKKLARAIVEGHRDEIMEQAIKAAEVALTRKPIEKLEKLKDAGKSKPAKIESRRGCLFLSFGKEETVL